jgi:branched-chain amino acid transport system substrate-binding protein
MISRRSLLHAVALLTAGLISRSLALAANAPGVTDAEIKIGQTMPYSGPASAYAVVGKTEAAYFKMINDLGGINGRKINLISLDDGYSHQKPSSRPVNSSSESKSPSFLGRSEA